MCCPLLFIKDDPIRIHSFAYPFVCNGVGNSISVKDKNPKKLGEWNNRKKTKYNAQREDNKQWVEVENGIVKEWKKKKQKPEKEEKLSENALKRINNYYCCYTDTNVWQMSTKIHNPWHTIVKKKTKKKIIKKYSGCYTLKQTEQTQCERDNICLFFVFFFFVIFNSNCLLN